MPDQSGAIASQTGAAGGLWTHSPVDWRGNEPPPTAQPGGWPSSASAGVAPLGSTNYAVAPSITAISASAITANTATINWTVQPSSSSIVEWGTTTAYGLVSPPVVGAGARTYALGTLTTVTLYHYRIASTANGLTTYSSDRTFTTV